MSPPESKMPRGDPSTHSSRRRYGRPLAWMLAGVVLTLGATEIAKDSGEKDTHATEALSQAFGVSPETIERRDLRKLEANNDSPVDSYTRTHYEMPQWL